MTFFSYFKFGVYLTSTIFIDDMDLNHIFNLFGPSGNKYNENPPTVIEIAEFEKTPSFKIGMFKKIILNQNVFQKKLFDMFRSPTDEWGVGKYEEVGEFVTFKRAWDSIKHCKIEEELWQDSLKVQHDDHLETAIKLSISFFEELEEYEKCAFLIKIQKFLESSLESES